MNLAAGRAEPAAKRGSTVLRLTLSFCLAGVIAPLAAWAATAAEPEGFQLGAMSLTSDHSDSALLTLPNGSPGSRVSSTTTITYRGTEPAVVRLYVTTIGTGLAGFLRVTITRGIERSGFVPDRLDYVGAGPGVLYRGTLAELPTSFGAGVADPATWTDGETHAYRFEVTLVGDERAQGRTARANFLFKARQA